MVFLEDYSKVKHNDLQEPLELMGLLLFFDLSDKIFNQINIYVKESKDGK